MEFIDLKSQYERARQQINQRIQSVLSHGNYILGPEVQELEGKLAEYCGVKHCVGVANGTDALQLALMALNVGPGDVVFTTAFSFFATAEVISLVGATPVFVDVERSTFNICPASLKSAVSRIRNENLISPKAIIAVDLFGLPANYPAIQEIANEEKLLLIEDAAQGFGGAIGNKKCGSFGDVATTSFFPAKPLGCYGDGGAVFTDNGNLADKIRSLRVHGKGTDKYDNVAIGMNSRLDTLQAAILLEKLKFLDNELEEKNSLANTYLASLKEKFNVPEIPDSYVSSWAQYCLIPKQGTRDKYMTLLKKKGIPTAVYYRTPLHKQSIYRGVKQYVDLRVSENVSKAIFSLPMHAYLSGVESNKIVETLLS